MFETISPEIAGGAVITAAAAVGVAYRHYRKGGTVEADVDGDGQPELAVTSNGCEDESADEEDDSEEETEDASDEQDPTPQEVKDIGTNLTEVKGVAETRADSLRSEGFDTAADLYYASDENLEAVHGLGPRAVSQIREDISGIDYEGNSGESDDSTEDDSSSDDQTEEDTSPEDTDGDGSSGTSEAEDESEDSEESEDGDDAQQEVSAEGGDSADEAAA